MVKKVMSFSFTKYSQFACQAPVKASVQPDCLIKYNIGKELSRYGSELLFRVHK